MSTGFVKDTSSLYPWITKGPGEDLDYGIDWADPRDNWLGLEATIVTSTWSIYPSAASPSMQKHGEAIIGGKVTKVWLNLGNLGTKYLVTNQVVASDGRTGQRTFEVRIAQR